MRNFIDEIERIGIERREPIVSMTRSRLTALLAEAERTPAESVAEVLAFFTLEPRPKWQEPPARFSQPECPRLTIPPPLLGVPPTPTSLRHAAAVVRVTHA